MKTALVILNVAIWFAAGYLSGEAKGRGWRHAFGLECKNGVVLRVAGR